MTDDELPVEVIPIRLGPTGRAYLVRQHGVILVDTGTPGSEATIIQRMKESGISPSDIRLILLTHGHADHAGSARTLRDLTGAPVAIHRDDAPLVRSGNQGPLVPTGIPGMILGKYFSAKKRSLFPPVDPDILIGDSFGLHEYGIRREVIPTPGHTRGSVSLLLTNGDVIVGDLIMPSIPGGTPAPPFWAEDLSQLIESVRKVVAFQDGKIYTGHGGPFTANQVRQHLL